LTGGEKPHLQTAIYEVKIITAFSAAHNLRNFRGKCENLHGHNWKVEVVMRGKQLDDSGVLVDFKEVKDATREILQELDHHYLNDLPFFHEHNPSSENIARYLYERLAQRLNDANRWLYRVSAWESTDACATFMVE
jgi:6-pyruvoyltetrahydropterin/6-carboxytetrahydropterin synthase